MDDANNNELNTMNNETDSVTVSENNGKVKLTKKIKDFFSDIGDKYRRLFEMCPYSFAVVMAVTLVLAFLVIARENGFDAAGDNAGRICRFLLYGGMIVLASELAFEADNVFKKFVAPVLGIVIGFLLERVAEAGKINLPFFKANYERVDLMLAAYLVICISICLFLAYKRSDLEITEYVTALFGETGRIIFVYGVLSVGIIVLFWMFTELLFGDMEYLGVVLVLLFGCYYLPSFLFLCFETKKDDSVFLKNLINYVLMGICIVGIAIIYCYFLKVIFTNAIPSNSIFVIILIVFSVSVPVSLMCVSYGTEAKLYNVAIYMPYVFAPMILLQTYALYLRIADYGLTSLRYMGIFCICFEVIYIVMYAFFWKRLHWILCVFALFAFIVAYLPLFNAEAVSARSQKRVFYDMIARSDELSDNERKRMLSAYNYLSGDSYRYGYSYGEEFVASLSGDVKEKVATLAEIDDKQEDTCHRYYLCLLPKYSTVDVSKYSMFVPVRLEYGDGYEDDKTEYNEDAKVWVYPSEINSGYTVYSKDVNDTYENVALETIDVNDTFAKYIEASIKSDKDTMVVDEISLPDGCKIVVSYISICYHTDFVHNKPIVESVIGNGYLLSE